MCLWKSEFILLKLGILLTEIVPSLRANICVLLRSLKNYDINSCNFSSSSNRLLRAKKKGVNKKK